MKPQVWPCGFCPHFSRDKKIIMNHEKFSHPDELIFKYGYIEPKPKKKEPEE